MKLDWKRAGCASIAEWRGFTFICEWIGKNMSCDVIIRGIDGTLAVSRAQEDITSAEAYCEAWLEQHDRPEWHDVTDWLSWAEWRGLKILVRPETACSIGTYYGQATEASGMTRSVPSMSCTTVEKAKVATEKWVREQGEKV